MKIANKKSTTHSNPLKQKESIDPTSTPNCKQNCKENGKLKAVLEQITVRHNQLTR
jgi:hypothetical protein